MNFFWAPLNRGLKPIRGVCSLRIPSGVCCDQWTCLRPVVRPRPEADPPLAIHRARPLRNRPLTRTLLQELAAHCPLLHQHLPALRRLHPPQHCHERIRGGRHHAQVHAADITHRIELNYLQSSSSTQSWCFVLLSVRSSGYKLGCTVATVSAQRPAEHVKKALQNIITEWTPHSVCQHNKNTRALKWTEGRRYCPRYLIDDFIGDGKGSCVREDQPCGEECIDGKEFCLASNSCLSVSNE